MFRLLRTIALLAVVGAGAVLVSAEPAEAQNPYWTGYWNWYDNTYRPYYYRYNYRYTPYGYQYNYRYYRPNRYYYRGYSPYRYGVRVGPLWFNWL